MVLGGRPSVTDSRFTSRRRLERFEPLVHGPVRGPVRVRLRLNRDPMLSGYELTEVSTVRPAAVSGR
ncbi:hypothetical protein CP556_12505 [Natrinema sp. CBA1119]|nr:hypothetical protein CP556_12505 [Natrinema sp. CBA1119]